MTIFNVNNEEWKTGEGSLFLGQQPALHDTINVRFPRIDAVAQEQISKRWKFNEFNHEQSRLDLLSCPKSIYDVMLMNLAYQWHADSVASRAIAPLFAPFVSNSELWEALMENTNMEITHAKTYSEIVRHCVPNPQDVFKMVMENEKTLKRAEIVNNVFDDLERAGAMYKLQNSKHGHGYNVGDGEYYSVLFISLVALYCLERIQFMASFAATFAIVEQGYFQSIGKAVQKIMIDELKCHAKLDEEILKIEISTERGQKALQRNWTFITDLISQVIRQELDWAKYLFSEGRSIVGLNEQLLGEWVLYNAVEVMKTVGTGRLGWEIPEKNPLPWMDNWIDIDKTQNAMQEADGNNYAIGVIADDIGEEEMEF